MEPYLEPVTVVDALYSVTHVSQAMVIQVSPELSLSLSSGSPFVSAIFGHRLRTPAPGRCGETASERVFLQHTRSRPGVFLHTAWLYQLESLTGTVTQPPEAGVSLIRTDLRSSDHHPSHRHFACLLFSAPFRGRVRA